MLDFIKKKLLFLLNRRNGSQKIQYFNYLKKNQWNSLDKNLNIQKELLYKIITYSIERVPYYQKFNLAEKDFSRKSIFEDIKRVPFLTKKQLQNNFEALSTTNPKARRNFTNASGGSTGEPVKFLQDNIFKDWSAAGKMLFNKWAGRKKGEPMIKLWGSERDILKQRKEIKSQISNWIRNKKILNTFRMSEEDMERFVQETNSLKPKLILAYVQSIYELAKYIENHNIEIYSPSSVMTSAGILYPEYRELISEIFDCSVFNRYGSREVSDMACDCEEHEGLHLNVFNHYIEVVDKNGQRCSPGELGKIVVTSLRNYSMPLLRYKIGDMGILSEKECSCDRGLPMLRKVVGRDTDIFKNLEGELIPGEYFIHFVGVVLNKGFIKKFQVIQEEIDYIVIKLVLKNKDIFNNYRKELNEIKDKIRLVMGEETKIEYKLVDKISPTKSGKYRYTISKVKND